MATSPILAGDIKLLASKVMDDVPNGGGGPTGNAIPDGASNAIFSDVTERQRAVGGVSIRQLFGAVQTPSTDAYMDPTVVLSQLPNDPNVSITLAKTSMFAKRAEIANTIEGYLIQGPEWGGYLLENHVAGQRSIQLFQRPGAPTPPIGRTLVLVSDEGKPAEVRQFVRVTRVEVAQRTFTYNTNGGFTDYQADVIVCDLTDALRSNFAGSAPERGYVHGSTKTVVRDTTVADAATFYGASPLTAVANLGDSTLRVASVYTQLVPSARTETPLSFMPPYSGAVLPIPGRAAVQFTAANAWDTTSNLSLPGGCLPGSLTIVASGVTVTDDAGALRTANNSIGTIDYSTGVLTTTSSLPGRKDVTYTPSAYALRAPQSAEIPVTAESRGQTYVGTILPTPQPGTLSLSYLAQGRWYVLTDGGSGTLQGADSSHGAGTVSRDTGAFVVSLGALPDVGSSIIVTWGVPTQETPYAPTSLKATQTIALAAPSGKTVQPGSLTVTWDGAKTASAGTSGVLTGDATGVLRVARGQLDFAPNVLPTVGTLLTIGYVAGAKHEDVLGHPARDGTGKLPVTASLGSIVPGSLEVEWNTFTDVAVLGTYNLEQLRGMGVTAMVDPTQIGRDNGSGSLLLSGVAVGTINYATGAVLFNPDVTVRIPRPVYAVGARVGVMWQLSYGGIEYVSAPSLYPNDTSGYVKLRYNSAGATTNETETVVFSPSLQLVEGVQAQVVSGSVVLTAPGALPWGDNGQGVLREFTDTGWMTRGAINYLTGDVALSSWASGTANAIVRSSCTTTIGENISSDYVFRTSAAPLRTGSLSVQFARAVGGPQIVTADASGKITAPGVTGNVDYDTGIVRVRFGDMLVAAGNEAEPWYAAEKVDGDGKIFKPAPVASSSLRYSAVAYFYLPIDAEILGLDPVRLPQDGRVPIYRVGSTVVLGHKGALGPVTVANGQTLNMGRTRLARVRVVGSDGATIHTGYSADLDAGTLTAINCTGWAQPVTVEHVVEQMARLRDVQIDGTLGIVGQLAHEFPAGTVVSSAIDAPTLRARVSQFFDQGTWDGITWSDSIIGNPAPATYNDTLAPVELTNSGVLTERFALRFTNSTTYECIGEHVGFIGTGSINSDFAPVNPVGSAPYFTLRAIGWGTGWAAGNVLFVHTVGAIYPFACIRTVQMGEPSGTDYSFELLLRGDVDRPPSAP